MVLIAKLRDITLTILITFSIMGIARAQDVNFYQYHLTRIIDHPAALTNTSTHTFSVFNRLQNIETDEGAFNTFTFSYISPPFLRGKDSTFYKGTWLGGLFFFDEQPGFIKTTGINPAAASRFEFKHLSISLGVKAILTNTIAGTPSYLFGNQISSGFLDPSIAPEPIRDLEPLNLTVGYGLGTLIKYHLPKKDTTSARTPTAIELGFSYNQTAVKGLISGKDQLRQYNLFLGSEIHSLRWNVSYLPSLRAITRGKAWILRPGFFMRLGRGENPEKRALVGTGWEWLSGADVQDGALSDKNSNSAFVTASLPVKNLRFSASWGLAVDFGRNSTQTLELGLSLRMPSKNRCDRPAAAQSPGYLQNPYLVLQYDLNFNQINSQKDAPEALAEKDEESVIDALREGFGGTLHILAVIPEKDRKETKKRIDELVKKLVCSEDQPGIPRKSIKYDIVYSKKESIRWIAILSDKRYDRFMKNKYIRLGSRKVEFETK